MSQLSREGVIKSMKGECTMFFAFALFPRTCASAEAWPLPLLSSLQLVVTITDVCLLKMHNQCRFLALRELIPHKDKMDKATFLQQAVEYIRQLQV
jgi:hypothetical protein